MPTLNEAEERMRSALAIAKVAENVEETWLDAASLYFMGYAGRATDPFLAEDVVREWERQGGERPRDKRAWGAVVKRLLRLGDIIYVGNAPASTSNGRLRSQWFRT
jgi:hypothetical protein